MQNKRQLEGEIELTSTMKIITQAYEEISVMRMQKIRDGVLSTRGFLDKLDEVFVNVKSNYQERINQFLMQHKEAKDTFLKKNGKQVSVMVTTDTKMNGEIVFKVFAEFLEYVQKNDTDIVIIGKVGKGLFEQMNSGKEYKFFAVAENDINIPALKELILYLLPYKKVNTFYGKFESLLYQNATVSNLSGEEFDQTGTKKEEKVIPFIFEPSIEKILEFFETQIFSSLVKQTISESELARYASRIKAMEEANQNIDKTIKGLYSQKRKFRNIINNKKQLETMSRVINMVR